MHPFSGSSYLANIRNQVLVSQRAKGFVLELKKLEKEWKYDSSFEEATVAK